ncbi:VOC family protein [Streptomyces violascens]|uniref:Glyoxalase n=1 Tax=Streptomyces violascens TaxID=67381 RepID=A0ABQ3QEX8_9ACTN|nr:VOC family protein [Streptomyces violascens]GGU46859.1 glyoxalase [Streptomyces violascens]GHI35838.1 glyoxalase [Streptomyces violascens]
MAIQRLNHAALYIRDLERSVDFYTSVLGFRVVFRFPGAAFLQAGGSTNDHDLGLFQRGADAARSEAGVRTVGLFHLAWEVETLLELKDVRNRLTEAGAQVNEMDHGTTKSLYAQDPDGLEFEVCWLVPAELLPGIHPEVSEPLDIDAEIERFGAQTLGGIGVSTALPR